MAVLNIRGDDLTAEAVERAKRAAAARGWTLARYLTQLVALHDVARAHADAGDAALDAELQALGLETQMG